MSSKNIFLGVFVGFATGTIFGAILNSRRGNSMRKEILIKGDHLASKIMDNFFDLLGSTQENVASAVKENLSQNNGNKNIEEKKDKAIIQQ